jgi:hypothetical protein
MFKFVKKSLIITLLVVWSGCATTNPSSSKHEHITPEKIESTCRAESRWYMHVGGVGVSIVQFNECLGVNKLLVMITPSDEFTPEIRKLSCELLGLHYLKHLNATETTKKWTLEKIKEIDLSSDDSQKEPPRWLVIYKMNLNGDSP